MNNLAQTKSDLKVMAIDMGGSHVKVRLSTGGEKRSAESGPKMTPDMMVKVVKDLSKDWDYDVIGMGYPGPVSNNMPATEPHNLAPGWKGYDFAKAFGKPLRMANDALMQAIGSYEGGRMLFLGLGTGLGSAMIVESICLPMELAHLPYKKKRTFEDYVGFRGLDARGKSKWRRSVTDVVERLNAAFEPDYTVIGGGNADKLKKLPDRCRLGDNENAFLGGFRIWFDDSLKF
ncbi:ROK family protein [Oryzifoliimicrobium ureilyticus]|uniref:ROK family protein n=1 Tax=Oryzifoliimicrobium ureilyticus TaxID=3113724 RepID=UPI0030760799